MTHCRATGRYRFTSGVIALLVGAGLVGGCGSSAKHGAATTTVATTGGSAGTTTVAATAPPATTAVTTAPTTSPPATTPPTTALVGLVLTGVGNTFTAPAAPTTKAFSSSCSPLVDPGFYGECVTISAPSGTMAAIVEQQQQNYQAGQPITAGQERDLVYREVNHTWSLILRRTPVAAGEATSQVFESDIMRDGDPKAVFVEPAANSQYANELDVVEASGAVTLYRQLHGGFATVQAGGGLGTHVPDPASGFDQTVIDYAAGAWRITSASHISDSQAQSLGSQAFFDPHEVQASS